MKLLMGLVVGGLAAWLYLSRAQVRMQLAVAPESFQHVPPIAASLVAIAAQRLSETIDLAPVPTGFKATAGEVAFRLLVAADRFGQSSRSGTEMTRAES